MKFHMTTFALSKAGAVLGSALLLSGTTLAGMHGIAVALTTSASALFQGDGGGYTERPTPVYYGPNPGRDPEHRGGWWTDAAIQDYEDILLRGGAGGGFEGFLPKEWLASLDGAAFFGYATVAVQSGPSVPGEGTWDGGGSTMAAPDGFGGGGSGFAPPSSGGSSGTRSQSNTSTGNKLTQVPLVGWESRGRSSVAFSLYHSSKNNLNGSFGYGWTHGYSTTVDASGGTAIVNLPDGLAVPFTLSGGAYVRPAGFFANLVNTGSGWTLTYKDGSVMGFDSAGLLSSVADRFGNATTLGRTSGKVTSVTSADGRALTLAYSGNYVSTITDPTGRVWTFNYATSGPGKTLTSIDYPTATGYPATSRSFTYDGAYNILTETDRQGKVWTSTYSTDSLASTTDPTSRTTSYSGYGTSATTITLPGTGRTATQNYSSGLLASTVDEAGFNDAFTSRDLDRNVQTYVDKRGKTWNQGFDGFGNTTSVTNPLSKVWNYTYTTLYDPDTATDPLGHTTDYTYTSGKLTKVTDALTHDVVTYTHNSYGDVLTAKDALNRTTTYGYNGQADVNSVTDPAGVDTTYQFDALGRPEWVKDDGLNQTSFSYDPLGRLEETVHPGGATEDFTYDKEGRPLSHQDGSGRTTYAGYDSAGRVLTETDGNGDAQTYTYTSAGFVKDVTDGNGHTRTFTRTVRGEASGLTLADGAVESWSYNGNGDVTQRIDPLSRTTTLAYDDAGRLTGINRPVSTDPTFSYDDADRQTGMTDASGTTTWTYDNANRLTTLDQPNGKQVYGYNNADQRTSMAEYVGATLLGTTTYAFNSTTGYLSSLANRFSQTTSYAYDSQGRLSVRTLPNADTETTTYDARSRVDLITLKNSGGTTLQGHDYGYDGASRVDQHKIGSVNTTYAYDGAGQLTSESRTGYSAAYNYDDNHNRTSRTVGGTTHTYAYDAGDKLQTVKVGLTTIRSYTYDAAGQPTAVTESAGTTNLVWDDDARMTSLTPPGSSAQTNAYNALGARVTAGTRSFARDGADVTSPVLRDGLADYTPGISERRSGNDRFLSSDIKSTDVQTLAAGGASAKRTYDAFGKVVSVTGTWNGPSGYGGKVGYEEDGNGLTLLGHRWYDAEVGRFLTRDPAKNGRNWYAYCGNDPIRRVD